MSMRQTRRETGTASTPRVWRGQTLRDRAVDRRELLLDAGAALLGNGGVAAVTMRAVVRAANLSPRYFYEAFDSREDLVLEVYDRAEAGLITRMSRLDATADLPAAIRSALELCAAYFEEDPGRARILLREPLGDDTLRTHSAGRVPGFLRAVAALGTGAADLVPAAEDDLAIIATALSGALVALYLDWADGRLAVERDALAEAATGVVLALSAHTFRR
ncbi:TetR/AcrR family transcriptional regulator [Nocardia higoensis]|uniref:TetR/AcrR family transcriptional regulator n=1 Tax=Nocardia higoensis TaxID=228599 RepID=A0ABS0D5T4_9NOCA|nr:TetR/AcrR family transcriptional regulator [Nocardia higoensis]MBF6353835.1 TetR/AcrR family transcriptional regulator [Nocardia higoensis]